MREPDRPSFACMARVGEEDGQASVELVAAVPVVLLVTLVVAQLAVAGYALWSAGRGGAGGGACRLCRRRRPGGGSQLAAVGAARGRIG